MLRPWEGRQDPTTGGSPAGGRIPSVVVMTTAPSPTWQRVHLRSAGVRDLLDDLDARIAAGEPAHAVRIDRVPEGYDDLDDLLVQVYGTWIRRLQARLEQAWELDVPLTDVGPEHAAAAAWATTARELPGARALLDAYADRPALRRLRASEENWMALTAGIDGATLIDIARAGVARTPAPTPAPDAVPARLSLRERLGRELRALRIA